MAKQRAGIGSDSGFKEASRFWERGRIWYNVALTIVVFAWVVWTWPHFRPALTLDALGKMLVLALLANVCYCAAYLADFLVQAGSSASRHRIRQVIWVAGMLFALLLENYWIADEIYPDVGRGASTVVGGTGALGSVMTASNMNFPAPLAVLGFLAACGGLFVALAAALIFWFARKPKFARIAAVAIGSGAVIYFGLLFGFSAGSHETALARGQEKYFCEIDCHLAYSIVDVKTEAGPDSNEYVVTLRTRFDETTTSRKRPKDAPLSPSPREARMIDDAGREYAPLSASGTSLMTPLKPAESYTTELHFRIPTKASGLRLLVNTTPGWADHLVIGDENSWGHKKTYFAL
jgi:hypothetical protein